MRASLHLGLFALALVAAAQADAQAGSRGHRQGARATTVVVETRRSPAPPPRWHQAPLGRAYRAHTPRNRVQEQRRDHDEIVRIARRWREASYNRNPHAKRNVQRRAALWIDREITEASRLPNRRRYVLRLHVLRRELDTSSRGRPIDYGHRPHRHAQKTRVIDELVQLSALELRRAYLDARRGMRLAFSVR